MITTMLGRWAAGVEDAQAAASTVAMIRMCRIEGRLIVVGSGSTRFSVVSGLVTIKTRYRWCWWHRVVEPE